MGTSSFFILEVLRLHTQRFSINQGMIMLDKDFTGESSVKSLVRRMKNKSRKLGILFEETANASSTQIGFFYAAENRNKKGRTTQRRIKMTSLQA